MMCQYRFINCNKCVTLVKDVDNGEGYICVGAGGIWEISVPSAQFCCKSTTALKNSLLKHLKNAIKEKSKNNNNKKQYFLFLGLEDILLFNKFIYLFIFGCIESLLPRVGFLQLWRVGVTLRCSAWTSHCGSLSCCRARALGMQASVVVTRGLSSCGPQALERRLSSCGARA